MHHGHSCNLVLPVMQLVLLVVITPKLDLKHVADSLKVVVFQITKNVTAASLRLDIDFSGQLIFLV